MLRKKTISFEGAYASVSVCITVDSKQFRRDEIDAAISHLTDKVMIAAVDATYRAHLHQVRVK